MKYWRDIEELASKERLEELLRVEKTPLRIAKRLGCSRHSVMNAMRHHRLKTVVVSIGDDMREKLEL